MSPLTLLTEHPRAARTVALVVALLTGTGTRAAPSALPFRVLESGPAGWILDYTPVPPAPTNTKIQGQDYLVFSGTAEDHRDAGIPGLPRDPVSFGIPPGAYLTAELLNPVFQTRTDQRVAPVPFHRPTAAGETVDIFTLAPETYGRNAFFPAEPVRVPEPLTIRYQRVGTVLVSPFQYNPATRELRTLVHATLRVTLHQVSPASSVPAPDDPEFEPLYRSLMCNYEQARPWRSRSLPGMVSDSTGDWFHAGAPYAHLRIGEDGWYRCTTGDLAAVGLDPWSLDPLTLKIIRNGRHIPVVVRPDTSVDFYALSNSGDETSAGSLTDTSAYWLTWGGTPGQRSISSPMPQGGSTVSVTSAYTTQHVEENTGYYAGTTEEDVIETEAVPGEGWYWERIFPNTSFSAVFSLPNSDQTPHSVALHLRLVSMTPDSPAVDHHVRYWVNDSLAGEAWFEGRTILLTTDSFPSSWLRPGTNTLRVSSLLTPSMPNLLYLDWFEIGFLRVLRAGGDMIDFTSPARPGTSAFTISGLSGDPVEVHDVDGGRDITGGIMSGDSLSGYTVTFHDTLSVPRRYHVGPAAGRPVPSLTPKHFQDLRRDGAGADYIVITHSLFRGAADLLAAHRALTGRRTRVVDVQDLYDEFAFGVEDPGAIRSFLRYVFEHWPAPAPASVLLLGDATWDPRRFMSTSRKSNFIPCHGVPAGDNWFVTADTSLAPLMAIGRLPVEDSVQALRTVGKLIDADVRAAGLWNKNFLMITGGTSSGEQETFNSRLEATIAAYLAPAPVGGTVFRAYKATDAVIDGEHRERIRSLVHDGLSFMNFLGHSGGRTWNVDIGDPAALENVDGPLPFVTSVSCNIAAFAEPSGNVLAEDLALADHRGALAVWASSSLGYPSSGTQLVNFLLAGMRDDSVRSLGLLTTQARIRLLQTDPSSAIVRAMVQLNPLIGDPLSRLALPVAPDFAADAGGMTVAEGGLTPAGIPVTLTVPLLNFGLVPAESTGVAVTDLFNGRTTELLRGNLPPIMHRDSLVVSWSAAPGRHTLRVILDPENRVGEVNEANNSAVLDHDVSAHALTVLSPLTGEVVLPGAVRLAFSGNQEPFRPRRFRFEVDTVPSFDSPNRMASGPVDGGPVTGEWLTPPLGADRVFFWRTRMVDAGTDTAWTGGAFSTGPAVPPVGVRLRFHTGGLLGLDSLAGVVVTDSGVTLTPQASLDLSVRSLGARADPARDYYSYIRAGDVLFQGRWEVTGSGFIAGRVHPSSGGYDFRSFDVPGNPAEAESMRVFVDETPAGDYLVCAAILDGRTNVTSGLVASLENLGSTRIAALLPGQSWALIGKQGSPGAVLEGLSDDSVMLSAVVPRTYAGGEGAVVGRWFPAVTRWDSLHWSPVVHPGVTSLNASFVAARRTGELDTLLVVAPESGAVSLSRLNELVTPAQYAALRPVFTLRSADIQATPLLREWSVDIQPPGDIAVVAGGAADSAIPRGAQYDFPVTLYNCGRGGTASIPVTASYGDAAGQPQRFGSVIVDSLPPAGERTIAFPLETGSLPPAVRLTASVWEGMPGSDLIDADNSGSTSILVSGARSGMVRLFSAGRQVVDGDYLPAEPVLTPGVPDPGDPPVNTEGAGLEVDGVSVPDVQPGSGAHEFRPVMSDGVHTIVLSLFREGSGFRDTLRLRVGVQVERTMRIVQALPYPNPFSHETAFTFMLTGTESPEEVLLRIFSVAGRRICDISIPGPMVNVGFNSVSWDGRDSDGDEVANGVYFYQLTAKGRAGKRETVTGKVARVR